MGNVLEFYLRLKDMMSGGLVKVAQTAKQTFATANNAAKGFLATNNQLIASVQNMGNKMEGVGGKIKKFALAFGFMALAGKGLAFARSSVESSMNYEATVKSFQVLTGSNAKGKALAGNLNQLQQETILGPEVFKAAQTLLGFGVAADKVVKIEKQLGDVSMGNKDKFESLSLVFAQTQAAGRLMGQDLLQYINAGFNPLQTMSEHWKEFGLKQATSVGQLKEMMEKGKISADMVAKSFEVATSKGGKFANMMDAIAQTNYGKMQILEGQFENFKIQVGNALMPVAADLMTVASKTLDWLNISKTAPQVLTAEHAEITSLLGVITTLNEKNDLRKQLLNQLIVKYPDLFKNIDAEKIKNGELLAMLNDINDAYGKRISLATSDLIVDTNKKALADNQGEYTRYSTMIELLKRGDAASLQTFKTLRRTGETFRDQFDNSAGMMHYYSMMANRAKYGMGVNQGIINAEGQKKAGNEFSYTIDDAYKLARNKTGLDNLFGNDKKGRSEFEELAAHIVRVKNTNQINGLGKGTSYIDFARQLRELMTPGAGTGTGANAGGGNGTGGGNIGGEGTAGKIASGGPRVININGVKFMDKLADKVSINNQGDWDMLERKFQDFFLRILNSGASVQ